MCLRGWGGKRRVAVDKIIQKLEMFRVTIGNSVKLWQTKEIIIYISPFFKSTDGCVILFPHFSKKRVFLKFMNIYNSSLYSREEVSCFKRPIVCETYSNERKEDGLKGIPLLKCLSLNSATYTPPLPSHNKLTKHDQLIGAVLLNSQQVKSYQASSMWSMYNVHLYNLEFFLNLNGRSLILKCWKLQKIRIRM